MKTLLSGITGFVGSHLAELLLWKGEEVFGIKRWRSPLDNISHILKDITLFDADLLEPNALNKVIARVKPDYIYHLAAMSYVPYSFSNPIQTLQVNGIGTTNLYEAVRGAKIDPVILCCSSSEVYGQVKKEDLPIKENQRFNPSSPYGVGKTTADLISQLYWKLYKLKIIITRAFSHTGPRRGEKFVVSAFAKQIAEIEKGLKEPVLKVGNLDSVRTFMDVRDTVKAYWLLLKQGQPGEIYNIGGRVTITIKEMLERLFDMSSIKNNIDVVVDENLLRIKDVTLQIPDCTKLHKTIDWKPSIPFSETLHDTLQYWRQRV